MKGVVRVTSPNIYLSLLHQVIESVLTFQCMCSSNPSLSLEVQLSDERETSIQLIDNNLLQFASFPISFPSFSRLSQLQLQNNINDHVQLLGTCHIQQRLYLVGNIRASIQSGHQVIIYYYKDSLSYTSFQCIYKNSPNLQAPTQRPSRSTNYMFLLLPLRNEWKLPKDISIQSNVFPRTLSYFAFKGKCFPDGRELY